MQGETCSECLRFEHGKSLCLLEKGACLNYDRFTPKPIITMWRSDFETKYISRQSFDEMKARAEAAEARVAELEAAARWIPVEERLPEVRGRYIFGGPSTVSDAFLSTIEYYEPGWGASPLFTHWRPLPVPPEVEG